MDLPQIRRECGIRHKYLNWVLAVLLVLVGGISTGSTYAVRVANHVDESCLELKQDVETTKQTQTLEVSYIKKALDDLKSDTKEIRKSVEELNKKVK